MKTNSSCNKNSTVKNIFTSFLTLALIAILFVQNANAADPPVTVTGSNGANNTYSFLKSAFDAINANPNQSGMNIVITINVSTIETATASLTGQATNSWTSLTIYPSATGLTISGAFAGPVITLDGADNVTIDGRLNATGAASDLTITSSAGQAIYFQAGSNSNTIKYCTLKGSLSSLTAGGIIHFAAGTGGNNDNIIDYNNFTNGGTRVNNAVYAVGSSGNVNSGNMIRYNAFYDHLSPSATSSAIKIDDYNTAWTISGNSFYETGILSPTHRDPYYFIWIPGTTLAARGTGYTVSGNFIGGTAPQCGGTALTKGINESGVYCIYLNVGTGTASNVPNNTIQNISWANGPNYGYNFNGIYVENGDVNVGSTTGTGNIIGSNDGTGSITFSGSSTTQYFYGINIQSANTVNCNYNKIGTITTSSSDATKQVHIYGIYKNLAGTISISNNIIGSSTGGSNSLNASSAATAGVQHVAGIYLNGTISGLTSSITNNIICGLNNAATNSLQSRTLGINADLGINTITGNTISNLSSADNNTQQSDLASVIGIRVSAGVVDGAQLVSGNTIYNLSNSNASFAGALTGLYFSGRANATYPSTVSKNFIYGFSLSGASSTAASIHGIRTGGGTTTYSNNIISLGGNTKTTLYGLYNYVSSSNETSSLYFNTVYLNGSLASGSTNKSYALFCPTTARPKDFRNNIFANARSTEGGTSLHYALYVPDASLSFPYRIDYNCYFVSGIGGVLGNSNAVDKTTLPLVTAADANSVVINPLFASAGGTVAADYLPSAPFLAGVAGTGISQDYAGTTRTYNSMGAYDYNMVTGKVHVAATAGTATCNYGTLGGAFAAINAGTHQGDITIVINASTVEPLAPALYGIGQNGTVNYTSLTMYPTAAGLSISGDINGDFLDLNNADNVTIDGRVNQSGPVSLEINNTSTGTSASTIIIWHGAQTNTIKYCTIKGSTTATAKGVVLFSTAWTVGNTGNVIDHCDITNANGSRPINAIYSLGTTLKENSGNRISKNHFYDLMNLGNNSATINLSDFNNTWTISGNSFYEKAAVTTTSSVTHTAINITYTNNAGSGFDVKDNYIGGSDSLCGGSAWTKSGGTNNAFTGIYLKAGVGTASSVQNNTIRNINYNNNSSASWYGINVTAGNVNVGTVTGNTIGASSGTNSIVLEASTASTGSLYGIYIISAAATVDCRNNVIGAITTINTPNTNAVNIYGIYKLTVSGTTTISNNSVGSTDAGTSNSINASSLSSGAAQSVWGIYSLGTGNVTISGNTVSKLTNGTTNPTPATAGLIRGIEATGGIFTITNNTVRDISIGNANTTAPGTLSSICGLYVSNNASTHTITGNTVYNISNSYESFAGSVVGMYVETGAGAQPVSTLSGNFINSVSVTGASSTTASIYGLYIQGYKNNISNNIVSIAGDTPSTVYGIYTPGAQGNDNFYFNTVYLGGTLASGSTNKSYALYNAAIGSARDYRNNIFSNTRSTAGGSNLHYAMYIVATGGTITYSDYNDYYTPGTGGILGYYGANKTGLPIVTGKDANSVNTNPMFVGAGGTAAANYAPTATLSGTTILNYSTDYAGATRAATPTMGAYEAVIPAPTITSFTPTSAGNGTTVAIVGTNLTNASAVSFGSTAATSFSVVNSASITAVVNSGTTGSVSVTTPGGTATLSGFTFIPTPTITSFTPLSAATEGTVAITGTNFTDASGVSFGGITASAFSVTNSTSITATVGSGATGSVSVTTPGGTATLAGFTFIACINPSNGGTISGTQSTCTGIAPVAFTSSEGASGYDGTLEYKWQVSTLNSSSDFIDISSSNSETYAPGGLARTSWFRRLARVACKSDWSNAVVSNVIQVTVLYSTPTLADFVVNVTPGGTIKWYSEATGGTLYAGTESLVNGQTYYASQTVNGVESTERLAVTATVYSTPQGSLTANGPFTGLGSGLLTWTSTSGTGPYTIVYNDGTADRTVSGVVSGTPFAVFTTPVTSTTTYTLVSVQDAHCTRNTCFTTGTATITIN